MWLLIGTWDLTMQHVAFDEPIRAREQYRPMLDGQFMEVQRTYERADFPDAVLIMSASRSFYFDVRGIVREFANVFSASGWVSERPAGDEAFAQRQTATFTSPDVVEAVGEMSHDDGLTWVHDYTLRMERVAGRSQS